MSIAFRRLVQNADPGVGNFRETLRDILQNGEAEAIVNAAYRLLVINPDKPDERPFRLLPLQAARIAQNDEQAFLLLFMWIRSRLKLTDCWLGLNEAEHRQIIGLMCVLSSFHTKGTNTITNRRQYLTRLWPNRNRLHEEHILAGLTAPQEAMSGPILLLPPPKILTAAIKSRVTRTRIWRLRDESLAKLGFLDKYAESSR